MKKLIGSILGSGSKGSDATRMYVSFDRPCSQAGSALRGKVVIEVGKDGAKLVQDYPDGLGLEAHLFGAEKVYWANQM